MKRIIYRDVAKETNELITDLDTYTYITNIYIYTEPFSSKEDCRSATIHRMQGE